MPSAAGSQLHEPLVLDYGDFVSGQSERVAKFLAGISQACRTQGFFQIVNHPISLNTQQQILRAAEQFFGLPLEEKMKLDKAQNSYNRGYEVIGSQRFEETDAKPDLKEGFYVSRDLPWNHPQVLGGKFAHGPNLWPESLGEPFRKTCMDYLNQLRNLTQEVLRAVLISLDQDTTDLGKLCHGAHRDFGLITLLLQGDVPGLEVWDEFTRQWVLVPPIEGAYVVNLGNLFQQWTNDRYLSNLHRVTKPPHERYSVAFLFHGNPDFIVKCRKSCRNPAEDERYSPVSVEDYVRGKYKEVYHRGGVYKIQDKD